MTATPPHFSLAVESDGVTTTVHLAGDLDIASAPRLQEELARLSGECRQVVIDLGGLAFIDSSGLTELWRAHVNAARDGWTVRFAPGSEDVARTLQLAGMLERLPWVR